MHATLLTRRGSMRRIAYGPALLCVVAIGVSAASGATLIWTGGGDGLTWLDANNWQDSQGMPPPMPPGVGDDVTIPGLSDVQVNGPAGAKTLFVAEALLKVDSELTIAGSSSIDRLHLNGDIINSDTLSIDGNSEWQNGRLLGGGAVENVGTFTVSGGTTRLIQGKLFRNAGTMRVGTRVDLETAILENNSLLLLASTISQRGLTPSSLINNTIVSAFGSTGTIDVPLINNGGSVEAVRDGLQPSFLTIGRGSEINGGSLTAQLDSVIYFQGPNSHRFVGTVETNGDGYVIFLSPVVVDATLTNRLTGTGGLHLHSQLSGVGTLVNEGVLSWRGGSISIEGGVVNNFAVILEGGVKTLTTTFRNQQATVHRTASLALAEGAEWINEPGSQYTFQDNFGATPAVNGAGAFINRGTLVKADDHTVNISSVSSQETATIDVDGGELRFNGASNHTGTGQYTVQAGAKLIFNDAAHVFDGQHAIVGNGSFENNAPSLISVNANRSLTVALSNEGSWRIHGHIMTSGELVNDQSGQATWVDNTIDVAASGAFINKGTLTMDVGNVRTLAGSGMLVNRGVASVVRGLNLAGTGGGILNEGPGSWLQASNLTFLNGSTGKTVNNEGAWRFSDDSIVFNPGGILANNTFRNAGTMVVAANVAATIHASFVAENSTITLEDAIVPPPPSIFQETTLSLTGGGQFVESPIGLGSNSVLDLTGTGGTKTYLFQSTANAIHGHNSNTSRFRIGPGARIVAGVPATFSVPGNHIDTSVHPGTLLDGGTLASGTVNNAGLFTWRSGPISADYNNWGTTVIETSSQHLLSGDFTNVNGRVVAQRAQLRIDASAGEMVSVVNQGIWQLEPGASITTQQDAPFALFHNLPQKVVQVIPGTAPHTAIIDAPMLNEGLVYVETTLADPLTSLNITAKAGVVANGALVSGAWSATGNSVINFPEPIQSLATEAWVQGTTQTIPALSSLQSQSGLFAVKEGLFPQPLENLGSILFNGKLPDYDFSLPDPLPAGMLEVEGDLNNRPGSKFDSAVDDSDGVSPISLVALSCEGGCPLPDVAVNVGEHQFINEGLVLPGGAADAGGFPLIGDLIQQAAGVLQYDLAGTMPIVEHDQAIIYGAVELGGTLDVRLLAGETPEEDYVPQLGDSFDLIFATEQITGTFNAVLLPELVEGQGWSLRYLPQKVNLQVTIAGDFDANGIVDGRDFLTWQRGGSPNPLSAADLAAWQANYGAIRPLAASITVPEPITFLLITLAGLSNALSRQRCCRARPQSKRIKRLPAMAPAW